MIIPAGQAPILDFYAPFTDREEYEQNGYKRAIADMQEAIKRYGDLPFEFEGKMYYITDDPLWQKMKADLMQVAEALLEDKQEGHSINGGL